MATSIIISSSLMVLALLMALATVAPQAEARAFFVFGDSLVDNGNNNYLATSARADSPPYGIDFPTHRPTGRFSNGLNIPDFISREIGSEFLLPYLSSQLTGNKLLVGANFASAGIGILNDTGVQFANIIRMFQQFEFFKEYQRRVTALIGAQRTKQLVNGALVLITVGGNDFVNNYYLVPYSVRSRQYNLPDYVKFLISEYKKLLMKLYDLGARRVLVTGTGPLGCVPAELALRSRNGQCSDELQRAASLFNPQLTQMLGQLNSQYGSHIFIAANTGRMTADFVTNPGAFAAAASVFLQAEARAFFVFGDSLVDSGNNNYLATTARADSPPYGIDYPTHRPTGRFSNGLNIPDIISERIGAEPVLPCLSPELTGQRLLNGANFASAGIGILNDTGVQFLNVIRMYRQLELFQQYKQLVRALIGGDRTKRLVNEALILITVGGNDFVNNYYLVPNSARSSQFALPDYVKYLISEYRKLLMKLYKLGARRVLVTGTGPLGCVPAELAMRSTNGGCSAELQRAASLYNPQLVTMLTGLNKRIGKNVFIGANTHRMHMNFISDPHAHGFTTSKVACCGQGPYNGLGLCTAASNLCGNRNLYAFWDAFHPSEKANRLIVEEMFSGSTNYMVPMNLSTVMALDART